MTKRELAAVLALQGDESLAWEWAMSELRSSDRGALCLSIDCEEIQILDRHSGSGFVFITLEPDEMEHFREQIRPDNFRLGLAFQILPTAIANEYIGDRVEILQRMAAEDCSEWKIHLETAKCLCWAVVFTLRRSVTAFLGRLTGPQ
jgi:hypothetical protein